MCCLLFVVVVDWSLFSVVRCLLFVVWLFDVRRVLVVVCCSLCIVGCLLLLFVVVCWSLLAACCLLVGVRRCSSLDVRCALLVVCCLLRVARCALFVACCSLLFGVNCSLLAAC